MARQLADSRPEPPVASQETTRWTSFWKSPSPQTTHPVQPTPLGHHPASKTTFSNSTLRFSRGDASASVSTSRVVTRSISSGAKSSGPTHELVIRAPHPFLHPISTIEQYWAMRATIAERLLEINDAHKRELTAATSTHEERRMARSSLTDKHTPTSLRSPRLIARARGAQCQVRA